jgi:hypothetical protein
MQAINEHSASQIINNFKNLDAMEFNPFDFNDDDTLLSYNPDPDLEYYNEMTYLENVSNCKYYAEESFSQKCENISANSNCFSLIQFNIRSVPKNLISLESYLESIPFNFTVIGLSETWLNHRQAPAIAAVLGIHVQICE